MKKSLLQLVVCPLCGGSLHCHSFEERDGDVVESGWIVCDACGQSFPLIGSIPRLLPPELQSMLWEMHPEFFRTYREQLPAAIRMGEEESGQDERAGVDSALVAQRETARSFGYEWQGCFEVTPGSES